MALDDHEIAADYQDSIESEIIADDPDCAGSLAGLEALDSDGARLRRLETRLLQETDARKLAEKKYEALLSVAIGSSVKQLGEHKAEQAALAQKLSAVTAARELAESKLSRDDEDMLRSRWEMKRARKTNREIAEAEGVTEAAIKRYFRLTKARERKNPT